MRSRRPAAAAPPFALPSLVSSLLLALAMASTFAACASDSEDDTVNIRVKDPNAPQAGEGGSGAGTAGEPGSSGAGANAGSGGNAGTAGKGGTGGAAGGKGGSSSGGGGAQAGGSAQAGSGGDPAAGGEAGSEAGASGAGGSEAGASGAAGEAGTGGAPVDDQEATTTLASIETIAATSSCYKYQWKDRGQMPKGYIKGVAKVFARAVCAPTRSDVVVVSQANTGNDVKDAISWFNSNFAAVNMKNDTAGVDTLRHAYTLLLGLGMRESSGEHCVGRDASATNTSSESAEAGAWQTSYDSKGASAELPKLFEKYKADDSGCLLDTFKEGVTCSASDWKNWGTGEQGLLFQQMEKECPAFAAEYAAVMLRVLGGNKGHYGPLRTKAAEIRPECDAMFHQVQDEVVAHPKVCDIL
jgi:hypothetical protein